MRNRREGKVAGTDKGLDETLLFGFMATLGCDGGMRAMKMEEKKASVNDEKEDLSPGELCKGARNRSR